MLTVGSESSRDADAGDVGAGALFGYVSDVAVDDDGNVYVLDIRSATITVVDSTGRMLRMIGSPGEGPGEFQYPSGVYVEADSVIVLRARGLMSVFDRRTGAYRSQYAFPQTSPYAINELLARRGDAYIVRTNNGRVSPDDESTNEAAIMVLPIGGTDYERVLSLPATERLFEAREDGTPPGFRLAPYARTTFCAGTPDRVYCGWNATADLIELSVTGDSLRTISLDFEPLPISAADRATAEEGVVGTRFLPNLRFSDTWPAFDAIAGDDAGRLWLKMRVARDDVETTLWVVDPESMTAAEAVVDGNFTPLDVSGNRVYGRLVDDGGRQLLRVFEFDEREDPDVE